MGEDRLQFRDGSRRPGRAMDGATAGGVTQGPGLVWPWSCLEKLPRGVDVQAVMVTLVELHRRARRLGAWAICCGGRVALRNSGRGLSPRPGFVVVCVFPCCT